VTPPDIRGMNGSGCDIERPDPAALRERIMSRAGGEPPREGDER